MAEFIDGVLVWRKPYHPAVPAGFERLSSELKVQGVDHLASATLTGTPAVLVVRFTCYNNNLPVSNIRVSNRTLIYNVCPKSALT